MLTLVRHGRTVANAGGLLQGRVDHPLDDLGRRQAAAVAASLVDVDVVVSSPLARARATAEAIASTHGIDVHVDERFIELDYGDYDQRPLSSIPASTWAEWQADPEFAPPGGERLLDLRQRVWPALESWAPTAQDQHLVVVSHVSPMKAAVQWALGVDTEISWRMQLATASICRIEFRGTRPSLTLFNDIHHLDGLV